MNYCGNCGKPVNGNADFCLNCGRFLNKSSVNCRFCTNCGSPVYTEADICVKCGVSLRKQYPQANLQASSGSDNLLDIGLIIVSILFPIVGFIIGAVIKPDNPVKASKYIKAASISLGIEIAAFLLICLFLFLISET